MDLYGSALRTHTVSISRTNNLLYDFSQVPIPTDAVDDEQVTQPRPWNIGEITRFILFIGPISSIFDYTSWTLTLTTAAIMALGIWLPYSPVAAALGFTHLPRMYWPHPVAHAARLHGTDAGHQNEITAQAMDLTWNKSTVLFVRDRTDRCAGTLLE